MRPLFIVDEFHTMFTDNAKATIDGLNPTAVIGLSATPKPGMNILISINGRDLKAEDMIKLDMHLIAPSQNGEWGSMLAAIKSKRDALQKKADVFEQNKGTYIRPIALIQVERTGKDQRGQGYVHSEDVREFLVEAGVPRHEIAVKSSSLDEIKAEKLLSKESEIRYIITKEALKEGWDCSFAYILGVIPNAHNNNSMTQLVGRILRQPYAKKTGIPELDESYVFFATGHTQEVLELVKKGFEEEGLGDVSASGIEWQDAHGAAVNPPQSVNIKKEIQKKYPESLFLPVWLVKEGSRYRKFSYEADVEPVIDWSKLNLLGIAKEIEPTIGTRRNVQQDTLIDLVEGTTELREAEATEPINFDTLYLARRFFETTGNAFVAQDIARTISAALENQIKKELLDRDAGYIAAECEKRLIAYKREQEQAIFEKHLTSKQLVLAVSDDEKIGFEMPSRDTIPDGIHAPYNFGLYDGVDTSSLDTLEKGVVRIIEESPNVLWWARNKAEKGWYAVQGWRKGRIRPDFIIARKDSKGQLEFVYVVESKGEQLAGNADTEYKSNVFGKMNNMHGKVETISVKTTTTRLNDRFEFELIPQGSEEMRLREKLNTKS
jgi:type III restriction enzyme